jgi:hypothetical protein
MNERASFLVEHADIPRLHEITSKLNQIGYTETAVRDRLGVQDLSDLEWRAVPMYRKERLRERDPLALAIELFLLQASLSPKELNGLFDAGDRDVLIRSGFLKLVEKGAGRAAASLFPVGNSVIFSDYAWPELLLPKHNAVPHDQVMFVGADSRALARCTVRRPVRAALDLCTGSGIQALLAAPHSERVLAVDINPRAALCTRLNAQITGATNLKAAVGDLFEAVPNERFDLITANPPFVPSPLNTLGFRDGGFSGEDVQKRIVAGLPDHLAPGGYAQMVTELGEREGEPLADRLREWLQGAPMDIHILRLHEYSAAKYAIAHAKGDDYDTFLDSVSAWSSNLQAQGYARIVVVIISFQWSDATSGPPWERMEEAKPPQRPAGTEIEATFAAERTARKHGISETLKHSRVHRAGKIALMDAQVLGAAIPASTKAVLMGQALSIEYQLDPLEREILRRLEKRTAMPDLLRICQELSVGERNVMEAVISLLQKKLVSLDGPVRSGNH